MHTGETDIFLFAIKQLLAKKGKKRTIVQLKKYDLETIALLFRIYRNAVQVKNKFRETSH